MLWDSLRNKTLVVEDAVESIELKTPHQHQPSAKVLMQQEDNTRQQDGLDTCVLSACEACLIS